MLTLDQFKHGDIIRVISNERNCGIDETVFTALVIDTKEYGLIAIPQDFQSFLYNQMELKGSAWEMEITWLIDMNVEVEWLARYN